MQPNITKLSPRCTLVRLPTQQFKTDTIVINLQRPMIREEATLNALLMQVVRRGCASYPDTRALSGRLLDLYDASIRTAVRKKGDNVSLTLTCDVVKGAYVGGEPLAQQTLSIVNELLFTQQGFNPEHIEGEKRNVRLAIESVINDKMRYADMRLLQELCAGEPSAISELGYADELSDITPEQLYAHYRHVLSTSHIYVYYCGDGLSDDVLTNVLLGGIDLSGDALPEHPHVRLPARAEIRRVHEPDDVQQTKLSIGWRTGDYGAVPSAVHALFDTIYGAGLCSKLFNHVRERLSLCYYVYSRVDRFLGVMRVNCGIEQDKLGVAYDEIMAQLDAVRQGDVTPDEFVAAQRELTNSLRSINDSAAQIIEYTHNNILSGMADHTIERYIADVAAARVDDVVKAAALWTPDTVYVLEPEQQ